MAIPRQMRLTARLQLLRLPSLLFNHRAAFTVTVQVAEAEYNPHPTQIDIQFAEYVLDAPVKAGAFYLALSWLARRRLTRSCTHRIGACL